MLRPFLIRVVRALSLLLLTSLLVFSLSRAMPGDVWTELQMDPSVSAATLQQLRFSYGLDRPWHTQYLFWLGQALRGNLGYSPVERQSIGPLLWRRVGRTLALASVTTTMTVLATLLLSSLVVQRKWRQRWLDSTLIPFLLAFPTVLTCLLLNWIRIEVLPPVTPQESGVVGETLARFFWPSLALSVPLTAFLSKQMRREVGQTLSMRHSVAAEAKGLPFPYLLRDALKPSIPVFLNLVGFLFASLVGGTIIAETVFDFPGLGLLTWHAMLNRDTSLLTAGVLVACSLVIVVNLIVDLVTFYVDPRLRKSAS